MNNQERDPIFAEMARDLAIIKRDERRLKKHLKSKNYRKSMLKKIAKKFDGYNPKIKLLDKMKYVGHKIIQVRIDKDIYSNRRLTRARIQSLGDSLSHYLARKQITG